MERVNVYHRKDDRWEGRISRRKCQYGKRKYKYKGGSDKENNCYPT